MDLNLKQFLKILNNIKSFTHFEFGIEDFHRSLRNSSESKTKGNNGWTFKKYVELLVGYRKIIENKEVRIPIIILGRTPNEDHQLEWISDTFITKITIAD